MKKKKFPIGEDGVRRRMIEVKPLNVTSEGSATLLRRT